MSSSCFALSLDFPDEHMSRIKGILQESQAVHELMAATVQEAAKSGCDANKAQSLIHKKFKANSMQKKGKLSTEVSRGKWVPVSYRP